MTTDLIAAWALDAVDDDERHAVERAIEADPDLAAQARSMREAVAAIAVGDAVTAPPQLRRQVLEAVATTTQQAPSSAPVDLAAARRRRARRRDRWLAAAAVVLAAAVPTTLAVQQAQRAGQAEEHVQTIAEALAEDGATLYGAQVAGGGRAAAVLSPQSAIFALQGLGEPAEGRDYQLWVVRPDGPESAGVLDLEDGAAHAELDALGPQDALALTVEPAGGSPQPTTDPVVTIAAG